MTARMIRPVFNDFLHSPYSGKPIGLRRKRTQRALPRTETEIEQALHPRTFAQLKEHCTYSRRAIINAIPFAFLAAVDPANAALVQFPATELNNEYILVRSPPDDIPSFF